MKSGTQKQRILEYMKTFGVISPYDALREFGCMRLGARIWDLRHEGHRIKATRVSYTNAHGEAKHYNVYSLEGEENT